MEYRYLGKTNLRVSRICFGALTIGPLQSRMPLQEGAGVLRWALERGINFIDTAELYGTYPYIREALKGFNGEVIIASKSYAPTAAGMRRALEQARRELDRDVIDIFLLHEQESEHTIAGHRAALEFLLEAKSRGIIRAVGISTHAVRGVKAAVKTPGIEVVHPLINIQGIGILDGSRADMEMAIKEAHQYGLGIYGMKPLGGGNLWHRAREALEYAFNLPELDAVAIGMKSVSEVEANIALLERRNESDFLMHQAREASPRRLHIESWCEGCGRCLEACPQGALLWGVGGKVEVDQGKCILCGYCGATCEQFCIKII